MYKIYRLTAFYNIEPVGPQVIYSTEEKALDFLKVWIGHPADDTTCCITMCGITGLSFLNNFHTCKTLFTKGLSDDFKRPENETQGTWDKPILDYFIVKEEVI